MPTVYPCVPGHEIVGRVTKVGKGVTKLKARLEQFCPNPIFTYNSPAGITYGDYSGSIVVAKRFVLQVPTKSRSSWCGSAFVCVNYYIFTVETLERNEGQEGGDRWTWWP